MSAKKASELVSQVQSHLKEINELLGKSKGVTTQDREHFSEIVSKYDTFLNENLSREPGAMVAVEQAPTLGTVPMECGANTNVKPAL